jgi:LytS/YehU family sensor histidine kinase
MAEAGTMIARLSDLLRATLASSNGLATLDEELDAVQAYLAIEAIRFGDRLQVSFNCEDGLGDVQVPVFTLQPLVENAVKHAVSPAAMSVAVEIGARRDGADLMLWVRDSGAGGGQAGGETGFGIGMSNVAARLQALYGHHGRLEATCADDGFQATVRLPRRSGHPS